jgi:hypothetical protein
MPHVFPKIEGNLSGVVLGNEPPLAKPAGVSELPDAARMLPAGFPAPPTKLQAWASEIKLRAERKAGEMLREMEKNRGGLPEQKTYPSSATRGRNSPLSELGITYDNSSRWQKLAEVPEAPPLPSAWGETVTDLRCAV